jgi:hypothetical protein
MKRTIFSVLLSTACISSFAQIKWTNVDSLYQPLPPSAHVYKTTELLDGKPNIAYYFEADYKDKKLLFEADTTSGRRLTPSEFFEKDNHPLLVVNCTFFSFETNGNLNVVINNGKILSRNLRKINVKQPDSTIKEVYIFRSAFGLSSKRKADIAWIRTDSTKRYAEAVQKPEFGNWWSTNRSTGEKRSWDNFEAWRVETAVGGGPVLVQDGGIRITNEEEKMFTGKAINDKHPRTAMGYTKDGRLIVMVIQGRFPGIAEGATLEQEARMLKDLGCAEALNLDGGGSSCMLVNGKETIKPSGVVLGSTGAGGVQRPVPAVFMVKQKL